MNLSLHKTFQRLNTFCLFKNVNDDYCFFEIKFIPFKDIKLMLVFQTIFPTKLKGDVRAVS